MELVTSPVFLHRILMWWHNSTDPAEKNCYIIYALKHAGYHEFKGEVELHMKKMCSTKIDLATGA